MGLNSSKLNEIKQLQNENEKLKEQIECLQVKNSKNEKEIEILNLHKKKLIQINFVLSAACVLLILSMIFSFFNQKTKIVIQGDSHSVANSINQALELNDEEDKPLDVRVINLLQTPSVPCHESVNGKCEEKIGREEYLINIAASVENHDSKPTTNQEEGVDSKASNQKSTDLVLFDPVEDVSFADPVEDVSFADPEKSSEGNPADPKTVDIKGGEGEGGCEGASGEEFEIVNPIAVKPADWNDEEDGPWEAETITSSYCLKHANKLESGSNEEFPLSYVANAEYGLGNVITERTENLVLSNTKMSVSRWSLHKDFAFPSLPFHSDCLFFGLLVLLLTALVAYYAWFIPAHHTFPTTPAHHAFPAHEPSAVSVSRAKTRACARARTRPVHRRTAERLKEDLLCTIQRRQMQTQLRAEARERRQRKHAGKKNLSARRYENGNESDSEDEGGDSIGSKNDSDIKQELPAHAQSHVEAQAQTQRQKEVEAQAQEQERVQRLEQTCTKADTEANTPSIAPTSALLIASEHVLTPTLSENVFEAAGPARFTHLLTFVPPSAPTSTFRHMPTSASALTRKQGQEEGERERERDQEEQRGSK